MKVLGPDAHPAVLADLHFYHLKSKEACLRRSGTASPSGAPTLPHTLGCLVRPLPPGLEFGVVEGGQVAMTEDTASHLPPGPEHRPEPVPH